MLTLLDLETTYALLEEGGCFWGIPFRRDVSCSRYPTFHIAHVLGKSTHTILLYLSAIIASIIRLVVYVILYPCKYPSISILLPLTLSIVQRTTRKRTKLVRPLIPASCHD